MVSVLIILRLLIIWANVKKVRGVIFFNAPQKKHGESWCLNVIILREEVVKNILFEAVWYQTSDLIN